ncbi:cupin domain-containing protein [Thalassotalea atypica]|uniref:cupin domain-containing protein n=1 Tax=Thalassotalea atypica TaxID=2054316 RepID=UPI002572B51B|nr:cupin domain-containing protein [Thalassotalea atypica]
MAGNYPDKIKELPMYNGRFDARRMNAEQCDILFASYPADTVIGPHTHETENWGVITKGELILTLNGIVSRYGIGQWYHVPANAVHAAEFKQETDEIEFWFES